MDDRPIGVFDSGVGGLTAVGALRLLLPGEDVIFFGDSARMPYGEKTVPQIRKMAAQGTDFLRGKGVKALIVACGTMASNAMDVIETRSGLPLSGVVYPAATRAAGTTKNGRVAVIATEATVKSGAFERALLEKRPGLDIISFACPSLAPMVERGHFRLGDPEAEAEAESCLRRVRDWGADTLILGCTHYPLLHGVISAVMGPEVALIDSSAEGAAAMAEHLRAFDMLNSADLGGGAYYTSGDPDAFAATASLFLGGDVRTQVFGIAPFEL